LFLCVSFTSYFSSSPHLPVLHSFPTRRSSDLISAQLKYNIDAVNQFICNYIPVPVRDFTAALKLIVIRSFDVNKPGAEIDNEFQDRKSTRLNSSHVSISYAVFCLKKKTTKQTQ